MMEKQQGNKLKDFPKYSEEKIDFEYAERFYGTGDKIKIVFYYNRVNCCEMSEEKVASLTFNYDFTEITSHKMELNLVNEIIETVKSVVLSNE